MSAAAKQTDGWNPYEIYVPKLYSYIYFECNLCHSNHLLRRTILIKEVSFNSR